MIKTLSFQWLKFYAHLIRNRKVNFKQAKIYSNLLI